MFDSENPDKEPVLRIAYAVYADGSTKTQQLCCADDDFWDIRKAMVAMRKQLDEDIRNGVTTCPFSPRNKAET